MWTNAVLTRDWRLVGGRELYDIRRDPGQRTDVAAGHPDVVARLRAAHEAWWDEISPRLTEYCPISIGHDAENPTRLCSMDVMGDVAWNQGHILSAQKSTGRWAVEVDRPGDYRFSLRRWPEELDLSIDAGLSDEEAASIAPFQRDQRPARSVCPRSARLMLFGEEESLKVDPSRKEIVFDRKVDRPGTTELEAWFTDEVGDDCGAYYVTAERLP